MMIDLQQIARCRPLVPLVRVVSKVYGSLHDRYRAGCDLFVSEFLLMLEVYPAQKGPGT